MSQPLGLCSMSSGHAAQVDGPLSSKQVLQERLINQRPGSVSSFLGRSKVKAACTELLAPQGGGWRVGGKPLLWFYRWEHTGPESLNSLAESIQPDGAGQVSLFLD